MLSQGSTEPVSAIAFITEQGFGFGEGVDHQRCALEVAHLTYTKQHDKRPTMPIIDGISVEQTMTKEEAKAMAEKLKKIIKMTDSKPKCPRDPNQLAKLMVDIASGTEENAKETATEKRASKDDKKGGPARAKALTPAQRSEIARIAAQARWKKKD